jgi:uncharacterized delta-60 repeat protein
MSARRTLVCAAVAAALLGVPQVAAAAGTIDTGFGSGGVASVPFGLGARAAGVALLPDGRIAVTGDQRGAGGEGALTARLGAAGTLDASFAGNGFRVDKFGTGASPQRGEAVTTQADGSTIVAGVAGDQWSLARFLPTGLTDGLFGAAGVTLRDPSPGGGAREEFFPGEQPSVPDGTGPAAVAIAPNGQIVVAGSVGVANDDGVPSEQIVVARFGATGVPDPSFGHDGFSVFQLGFGSAIRHAASAAHALSLLPDGRILIAGRASARNGGDRALLARLTTSGSLDLGFARQGRLLYQFGRASTARVASSSLSALVQRPDGRIVAAGRATDVAGEHAVLLAGFAADGTLDTSFARLGSAVSQLGAAAVPAVPPVSLARALALQPDGAAVVAGAATGGALAARYDATGGLECGYGNRGRTLAFNGARFDPSLDGAAAAALQPDGKLLVAGRRAGGGLLLARLQGGASAPVTASRPRLVTLGARYTGNGRGFAYARVDGGCRAVNVRFSVKPQTGATIATRVQRVFGRSGPQVVCAPLSGLRQKGSYHIRIEASPKGGARGAVRTLKVAKPTSKILPQEGCR